MQVGPVRRTGPTSTILMMVWMLGYGKGEKLIVGCHENMALYCNRCLEAPDKAHLFIGSASGKQHFACLAIKSLQAIGGF